MLYFENDYTEGACSEVLSALIRTNDEKLAPYGGDKYSLAAAEKIRAVCSAPDAEVFFISGGTHYGYATSVGIPYKRTIFCRGVS